MTDVTGARRASRRAGSAFGSPRLVVAACCVLGMALMALRVMLWPIHSTDQDLYFLKWHAFLIEHGRLLALKQPISDYFPSFFELTSVTSLLDGHISRLAQIKLLPFCFDLLAAGLAYLFVRTLQVRDSTVPQTKAAAVAAFFAVLAGPTVILDGSAWGQTDIIYTFCLLLTLLLIVRGNGGWASLAYGFAFAFKLQSVFLAPFFVAMVLRRRMPFWSLLLLPVGWLLSLIPPVLVGGSFLTFAKLPFVQSHELPTLAINVPNPWAAAEYFHVPYRAGLTVGLILTAIAFAGIVAIGLRKSAMTPQGIAALAASCLLLLPYIMPKMHDRYFFPAEVLLSILACVDLAFLLPAALVISASLFSYLGYFVNFEQRWATALGIVATSLSVFVVLQRTLTLTDRSLASAAISKGHSSLLANSPEVI